MLLEPLAMRGNQEDHMIHVTVQLLDLYERLRAEYTVRYCWPKFTVLYEQSALAGKRSSCILTLRQCESRVLNAKVLIGEISEW